MMWQSAGEVQWRIMVRQEGDGATWSTNNEW
jgi:hypothetical protein